MMCGALRSSTSRSASALRTSDELVVLQVAQPAVDQLGRRRRSVRGQVVPARPARTTDRAGRSRAIPAPLMPPPTTSIVAGSVSAVAGIGPARKGDGVVRWFRRCRSAAGGSFGWTSRVLCSRLFGVASNSAGALSAWSLGCQASSSRSPRTRDYAGSHDAQSPPVRSARRGARPDGRSRSALSVSGMIASRSRRRDVKRAADGWSDLLAAASTAACAPAAQHDREHAAASARRSTSRAKAPSRARWRAVPKELQLIITIGSTTEAVARELLRQRPLILRDEQPERGGDPGRTTRREIRSSPAAWLRRPWHRRRGRRTISSRVRVDIGIMIGISGDRYDGNTLRDSTTAR